MLVVWITSFGTSSHAQTSTRIWSVTLNTNSHFSARKKAEQAILSAPHLQFAGSDFIVIGFDDNTPSYPEPLPARHFNFHLLEVDSGSGDFEREVEFPVVNLNSDLQVMADDNLLLLTGEKLLELSPRLETLQSLATPLSHHREAVPIKIGGRPYSSSVYEWWKMSVSSTGNVVLLQHKQSPQQTELRWISTDKLTTRRETSESQAADGISATDDSAILEIPFHPFILSANGSGRILPDCQKCGATYFVSQDRLFEDRSTTYRIADSSGRTLAKGKLEISATDISKSSNGSRIAFMTGTLSRSYKSIHDEVIIFDLSSMKEA